MTRGTTPTLTLSIDNADLSTLKNMYITFSQETRKLIKVYQAGSENNQIAIDVENSEVAVSLTQDETLKFKPGPVDIQVRYTNKNVCICLFCINQTLPGAGSKLCAGERFMALLCIEMHGEFGSGIRLAP